QCIRPLIGALLPAIMDISARATSLADRPQRAKWVTSARTRREDRSSISSHPLATVGRGLGSRHRVLIGRLPDLPHLEVPAMSKNAPGAAEDFNANSNWMRCVQCLELLRCQSQ